jgi:transposase
MIDAELEARILRCHLVEKWTVGVIARELKIHHTTVRRALNDRGVAAPPSDRPSMADPYLGFIHDTLTEHPRLPASRLYRMVVERGYNGGPDHFRRLIAQIRPRKAPEAFLRRRTLIGEEAQADWGHFGLHQVGNTRRALSAFVMVLSWSRRTFVRFFWDQQMGSFLDAHVAAFGAFGGVPRTILYDNLKSVVIQRRGELAQINEQIVALAQHYNFQPRPVGVRRGNEKGRVERAIGYLRTSFWPPEKWTDLADLNAQAGRWCQEVSGRRVCPEDSTLSVWEAGEHEQTRLLSLPDNPYPAEDVKEAQVGKQPYVRFDRNDYSVPAQLVSRMLTVRATSTRVRILDRTQVVADHPRSFAVGMQIEEPTHLAALEEQKRRAREARNLDRLHQACPTSRGLIERAVARHRSPRRVVNQLLELLDRWGLAHFEQAIQTGDLRGASSAEDLLQILQQQAEARTQPPPVPITLPNHPGVKDMMVRPHDLTTYDQEPNHG